MTVLVGDCVEVLTRFPDNFFDSVVTDPPYGLEFMGKDWDSPKKMLGQMATGKEQRGAYAYGGSHSQGYYANDPHKFQEWTYLWAVEVLRVLKPGAHLLAFGGTRTYHRLACAIEDAGFQVRDQIQWLYGSGFPKSHDVSKAIDKAAGAKREVVGSKLGRPGYSLAKNKDDRTTYGAYTDSESEVAITAPATTEAEQWAGWGTALKPAHEPIVLARKPFKGTVANNVLEHGTGALNIDGTRIGTDEDLRRPFGTPSDHVGQLKTLPKGELNPGSDLGRWPANVILSHAPSCTQVGTKKVKSNSQSKDRVDGPDPDTYGEWKAKAGAGHGVDGTEEVEAWECEPDCPVRLLGEQSRFFYSPKVSKKERNFGLDAFEARFSPTMGNGIGGKEHDPETATPKKNVHPTVKPIALMGYLIRLVTPPGGIVLDPFTGSGSTGIAAHQEGMRFMGIEQDPEYAALARARIKAWKSA